MNWAFIYRAIVGYDFGVFLSVFIRIVIQRQHVDNIELLNAFVCTIFIVLFWNRCEWSKIFRRSKK